LPIRQEVWLPPPSMPRKITSVVLPYRSSV
jgi:hypothetical protein